MGAAEKMYDSEEWVFLGVCGRGSGQRYGNLEKGSLQK